MKSIKKEPLDRLIALTREIYRGSLGERTHNLVERIHAAEEIAEFTGLDWIVLMDLLDCILSPNGLKPDASDRSIYNFLEYLGWFAV